MKKLLSTICVVAIVLMNVPIANAADGDIYIDDKATVASDTNLEDHTPTDTGTGWTERTSVGGGSMYVESTTDNYDIDGGSLGDGVYYTAQGTYSIADYETCVDVEGAIETSDDPYWIIFRFQDTSNTYALRFNEDSAQFYKQVAASWSTIGSEADDSAYVLVSGDTVCVIVEGDVLRMFHNNQLILSLVDASHTAAGEAGIGVGNIGADEEFDSSSQEMDNFLVTEIDQNCTAWTNAGSGSERTLGGSVHTWANPGNVTSSDNNDAQADGDSDIVAETTRYLTGTGFGLAISASSITGIDFRIERACTDNNANEDCTDNAIRVIKGGTIGSTDMSHTPEWPTTDTYDLYGTGSNLWGDTWTESDVEEDQFGVAISVLIDDIGILVSATVDNIQVRVCYVSSTARRRVWYY